MTQKGFSLLELSIVLVIIGLIAGGIVAGASMIRAAELRKVLTSVDQYKIAVTVFRDKYFGLPGDLKNATAFWGEAHATPATCKTTVSTGVATCDGDGNGRVDYADDFAGSAERFRFWQQLASAGLVSGSFTGVTGSGSTHHAVPGQNTPEVINGVAAHIYRRDSGSAYWFNSLADSKDFLIAGAEFNYSAPVTPAFTAEEVWNLDKKVDDGKPGQGNLMTGMLGDCSYAATSAETNVDYRLNNTDIDCFPVFRKLY